MNEAVYQTTWSYEEAFSRNIGVLSEQEQARLRSARVAVAGMGGVGGIHLVTLARLGIGKFTIADADVFECANHNRQYGAKLETLGRPKAVVMAEEARAVNPQVDIRVFEEPVGPDNVADFLDDVDVFVDGLDFFVIDARRTVFQEARRRGLWSVTAGPHAFSTAWLVFDPDGMSFDEFFDIHDSMDELDKVVSFAVGCVPSPIHLTYLDFSKYFQPGRKKGASLGLACNLASGIVAAETCKILLNRGNLRPAPCYAQFDAHRLKLRMGRLWRGNRHPWQLLKRRWLRKKMQSNEAR